MFLSVKFLVLLWAGLGVAALVVGTIYNAAWLASIGSAIIALGVGFHAGWKTHCFAVRVANLRKKEEAKAS